VKRCSEKKKRTVQWCGAPPSSHSSKRKKWRPTNPEKKGGRNQRKQNNSKTREGGTILTPTQSKPNPLPAQFSSFMINIMKFRCVRCLYLHLYLYNPCGIHVIRGCHHFLFFIHSLIHLFFHFTSGNPLLRKGAVRTYNMLYVSGRGFMHNLQVTNATKQRGITIHNNESQPARQPAPFASSGTSQDKVFPQMRARLGDGILKV